MSWTACVYKGMTLKCLYPDFSPEPRLRLVCPTTFSVFVFVFVLTWTTFFKVFIEFVTILLLFYILVFWLQNMWDLQSLTRDQIHTRCIRRRSLNHWTTREVPTFSLTSHRDFKPTKIKTLISSLLVSTLALPSIQLSRWKPGNYSGLFLFLVCPSHICLILFLSSLFGIYCMVQCTYLLSPTLIQSSSNLSFT